MPRPALLAVFAAALVPLPLALTPALAAPAAPPPAVVGAFAAPFEERGPVCRKDAEGRSICKPAAVSIAPLADGRVVYWDGLEGSEDLTVGPTLEYPRTQQNDVSRVLDLRGTSPRWQVPTPADGGANPNGNDNDQLPVFPKDTSDTRNDGDLFCSNQVHLYDGRVLSVGGTSYYYDPGVSAGGYGPNELAGLKSARFFDPATNRWKQTGGMSYGRWYPATVTLPDGKVLAASGVSKLLKPAYYDRPTDSGRNVTQTEVYDPRAGTWKLNPPSADKSLPLYPRLHLLPNGNVYFDAAGQTYNPFGQAFDEATWNSAAVLDTSQKRWRDIGLPQFGPALKGFRGSTFSVMLPLTAPYTKAQFLGAGGVYGVTPGTYLASRTSTLNTVDVSGGTERFSSEATGELNDARWYASGVVLPTGQVLAMAGADRDETVQPGSGTAVKSVEMYDPATKKWTRLASAKQGRTYHNTAVLLPDGRVLLGGHSPLPTFYGKHDNTYRDNLGWSEAYRDPSFEIFSPPYLFAGKRPVITAAPGSLQYGRRVTLGVDDPSRVASVVVVRNPAITHLHDNDQRTVELKVVGRTARTVTVEVPKAAAVLPPGPYMLFVNGKSTKGLVPSVSRQVFVGTSVPASLRPALARNAKAQKAAELGTTGTAGVQPATAGVPVPVPGALAAVEGADGHAHEHPAEAATAVASRPAASARPLSPTSTGAAAGIAVALLLGNALVVRRLRTRRR